MLAFALWKSQNFNEALKLVEGIIAMGNTDEVLYLLNYRKYGRGL